MIKALYKQLQKHLDTQVSLTKAIKNQSNY